MNSKIGRLLAELTVLWSAMPIRCRTVRSTVSSVPLYPVPVSVGRDQLVDEPEVVLAVEVPVLEEPEVVLPDRPLYGGRHPGGDHYIIVINLAVMIIIIINYLAVKMPRLSPFSSRSLSCDNDSRV